MPDINTFNYKYARLLKDKINRWHNKETPRPYVLNCSSCPNSFSCVVSFLRFRQVRFHLLPPCPLSPRGCRARDFRSVCLTTKEEAIVSWKSFTSLGFLFELLLHPPSIQFNILPKATKVRITFSKNAMIHCSKPTIRYAAWFFSVYFYDPASIAGGRDVTPVAQVE